MSKLYEARYTQNVKTKGPLTSSFFFFFYQLDNALKLKEVRPIKSPNYKDGGRKADFATRSASEFSERGTEKKETKLNEAVRFMTSETIP